MKRGSVMDILGKSSSKSTTTTSSSASSENVSTSKASLPILGSMFKPSGWSCDICLVNNKEGVEKCAACQTPKPAKQSATNAASSTLSTLGSATPSQSLFKQVVPSGTWTCDVCLIQNKPVISMCAACQTLKPAKSSTWTCDTCLIQNKVEVQVCAACSANKPASKSDTSGKSSSSDSLFDKFKPASGQWSCAVCLVQNKTYVTSCVACKTPKPSKPFKHPPGDWTCETCLVSNTESDVACVACRDTRPDPPRTQTVPSCVKRYSMAGETSGITVSKTGGFTFGSLSTSQSDTKSGFTFGAPSSEKKTATGGFKIGASKDFNSVSVTGGFKIVGSSVESSSTPATAGFKFAGSDSSGSTPLGAGFKFGAPSGESSSTTPSGGFKFGAPISRTSSSETKTTTGFQLGSGTNTTSASSEVKVSSASISEQASIGGFQVGTSSVVSGKKPDTEKATGANQTSDVSSKTGFNGFQFGQSDSSSSSLASNTAPIVSTSNSLTTGFSFGQISVNSLPNDPLKATMPVPGGFSFQTSSSSASSASGLTNTSTSQTGVSQPSIGGFTFSATNKTETSSAPPSSSSQAPTGGFSFGAANTSTQESTKTETKAGFGGFEFGQKPPESSTSTTSMLGGFNFAQKAPNSQPAGSETSTTKRGRDEGTTLTPIRILNVSVSGSEEYHDQSCDPCRGKGTSQAAVKYCPVCDELLCQGCVGVHLRNKVLKDHPLNDNLSTSFKRKGIHPLALCDKHKTEKVEQYCKTHNVLCCAKCRLVTHKRCEITVIKKMSQSDNQAKLLQDSLQLIQSLQQNVKRIKDTQEKGIESLKINKDQCFTKVRALKKEVDDLFVTLEKEILDEVVKTEANIKSKLDNEIVEAENLLQQLNNYKGLLEDCHSTSDNELMFIGLERYRDDIEKMTKLVAELQNVIISPDLLFEAQQDVKNLRKTLSRLGIVKSGKSMGHTAQVTGATSRVPGVFDTSRGNTVQTTCGMNSVNVLGVTVSSQRVLDVNSDWISGSTFLGSGELILCDRRNSKLLLFNPELTLKNDLMLSGQPWDVAAITDRRVAVTMPGEKLLQFVDLTPTMKNSNQVKYKSWCRGISSTQSHLYMLLYDLEGHCEVLVLDHDGRQVKKIDLTAVGIRCPLYITVNRPGDRLFVSDAVRGGTNSVYCLDAQSGTLIFRHSSDQLNSSLGIYVDDHNNLLVCGLRSNNITVVTAEGRHERVLLSHTDGLKSPLTVTYRPRDGTLVVGMSGTSPVCRVFHLKSK